MKYIKVLAYNDYSVFEVIEEYEKTIKCKLSNCEDEDGYIILSKNNIIKQADTIEELCDEFIVINEKYNIHKVLKTTFGGLQSCFKQLLKVWDIIYGAIWTDKGLIYVVKMNDKGKLKLI